MSARSDDELLAYGGAAVLLGLAVWKRDAVAVAAGYVVNAFERGERLSHSTVVDGVVTESPDDLVAQASSVVGYDVDPDLYALARMGRSEGVDGMAYRMHVALNDLAELQRTYGTRVYSSLSALLTHSKVARADGHFSQQYLGKRQASSKDPYVGDLRLAEQVCDERAAGVDPTGGATKFVDVDAFTSQPGADKTYDEVLAEWIADGYEPSHLPGATDNFVVFRRTT